MNHRKKAILIIISVFLTISLFAGGIYLKSIGDYKAKVDTFLIWEYNYLRMLKNGFLNA